MLKICKKGYIEMGKQLYLDSNVKYCDLKDFLKAQFVIFRCQKYVKKRVHGNKKINLPWDFKIVFNMHF